ncbi:OadG family transporter subunit [Pseudidiomarina terrestris]|uniref:Probable oxaloacetate decarboxylase gamma chain n=1 Tax=Pseudidiomarina terrestris TaxID=2820060 RepID=A0AAW7QZ82_9GAMM|nr:MULTISPECIES: OadG family transporter subunit [unclassified Pseudidiomarina]MDN7123871.1 OadG family protein [Pseudidiomarina sp. 1APP75-32.1]MDN7127625.1 OadG family protein [Pseudidiomarina sp. 1APR75-33.1]MDN7130371.1 OadG family protein [Pseudidiomarina sp. 1APR75-15]MDN7136294.1 OadG family protein [Pseudidiomarina sp. 1ASP75-5]MDN7138789.1 OadG family protein [Pseudidiomarina sp. 1ASP75-14]
MQQQLSEALTIMLTGMITVFVFLTLLLLAMHGLRRFVGSEEQPTAARTTTTKHRDAGHSGQRIAAITAAVHAYRREHE